VQLLAALAVGVTGRLPVHLGEMRLEGAALRESFPASATAEWPDPCKDGVPTREERRGNGF
jgi:hypothetical protein